MSMLIPFRDKTVQPFGQVRFVREVSNGQALALQDTEPLLHLIHPRTMHRRMMKPEARMLRQPSLYLFARVHPQIVHHQVDLGEAFGNVAVQLRQEFDELLLPFSLGGMSIDLARSRVESSKQVQGSLALVLVLHTNWHTGLSRQRRRLARSRLQARFL